MSINPIKFFKLGNTEYTLYTPVSLSVISVGTYLTSRDSPKMIAQQKKKTVKSLLSRSNILIPSIGHPSKYYLRSTLLNTGDRMITGVRMRYVVGCGSCDPEADVRE